ncbi:hypothetical protein P153DRAFT_87156 [Dothidotthia symphoricarpi CBS 119687]|uniref:Uncharacterized protein n=1 Tax=Dothidotthia symphoricarpi CBS 119687 TaxID=1392245 RepID=A0A6A6A2V8_9PLEO|nr:uncharacterized protein P153DRAFT_87156 [Dothidotthia symphoricarpi CBS 119687]KAF2126199.1 hypothetical protein P153DRAFT_87156 [Dothidotthia symphoricarpi CBS 119687]
MSSFSTINTGVVETGNYRIVGSDIVQTNENKVDIRTGPKCYNKSLEYLSIAAHNDAISDSSCNDQLNLTAISLKRALAEASINQLEQSKKIRKLQKPKSTINSNGKEVRVGCPFFKSNPQAHAEKMGCRGKGFLEMSKLKPH